MHQRKRNRLQYYDYSNAGWYFVTISPKDHKSHFGKIINEKIILNEVGFNADKCWNSIPIHFSNIELDEYIIMPDHIHGILIIDYNINPIIEDEIFRPLHKTNLSNVIKGFKIGVTKWCKENNCHNFKWQRSFYERIN